MAKRILRNLKLSHIAAVDFPCQEGAKALLIKSADRWKILAKSEDLHARTFAEIITENEERQRRWAAEEAMWPLFSALRESLASIASDAAVDSNQKLTRVQESVSQFIAALREKWPDVADEIQEIAKASPESAGMAPFIEAFAKLKETEVDVTELEKANQKIADLEKRNGELTTQLEAANTAKAKMETDLAEAKEETKTAKAKVDELEKASDEKITVGGQEVSKLAVGPSQFAIFKGLQDEAITARLEKRVGDDFSHLPGTVAERAAVLKHMETAPDEVKKSFEQIMTTAEKVAGGAFESIGTGGTPEVRKARGDFMAKVGEIQTRDKISRHQAMSKARVEFPAEFEAYNGTAS